MGERWGVVARPWVEESVHGAVEKEERLDLLLAFVRKNPAGTGLARVSVVVSLTAVGRLRRPFVTHAEAKGVQSRAVARDDLRRRATGGEKLRRPRPCMTRAWKFSRGSAAPARR